jgi:hypothetical protein
MSDKSSTALVALAFAVLLGNASESAAQATKIRVDFTKKSIDTGVKLDPGDIVEVTEISGTVQHNRGGKGHGPEGSTEKLSPSYHLYANAQPGTLLAYVGDAKNHYQVRKSIFAEAKSAGNLFFAINDAKDHYHDNAGGFDVSYRVIKKAMVRSPSAPAAAKKPAAKLDIQWVNKTGGPITVNWIDTSGTEKKSAETIAPNKIFAGSTYVGHLFRVRDAKGAQIGLITVEPTSSKVDILK